MKNKFKEAIKILENAAESKRRIGAIELRPTDNIGLYLRDIAYIEEAIEILKKEGNK